jgi:hypothetical protein
MALKTYTVMKTYEDEKIAFSGLPKDLRLPIVRYLGCYTHDYTEHVSNGKSYNLLLEYGEKDLEEYWADLTNVPPVQTTEIICFWKSLFDVADAIQTIHNLQIFNSKNAAIEYTGYVTDSVPKISPLIVLACMRTSNLTIFSWSMAGSNLLISDTHASQRRGEPEVSPSTVALRPTVCPATPNGKQGH